VKYHRKTTDEQHKPH